MRKLKLWEEASQHHLTVAATASQNTCGPLSTQPLADVAQGTWEIIVISSL